MDEDPTELTPWQKLNVLAMKYYGGYKWEPKAGDYYTTCRADLELYQIVKIEDGVVYTRYCDARKSTEIASWREEDFLSPTTFGYARCFVHPTFLQPDPRDAKG